MKNSRIKTQENRRKGKIQEDKEKEKRKEERKGKR